ncbi:MobF family relaxase, partial [Nocardia sp. CNY236]|uniref:MobF family relaxase n=1 Tax=Nocardia sp. CNY236 TaxID=1169152 RepID=UPI0012DD87BA
MTATLAKISAGDGYKYYLRHVAAHDLMERDRSSLADYYSARGESPGWWLGSGLRSLRVDYRGKRLTVSEINVGDTVTESQMKSLFGLGRHPQADLIEDAVIEAEVSLDTEHAGAKPATRRATKPLKLKDAKRAASQVSRLGAQFRIYSGVSDHRKRCAVAFNEYNTARGRDRYAQIPDDQRAAIRTEVARDMFVESFGRPPLDARELSGWVARNSRQHTTAVAGFDWTFSPVKSVSTLWAVAPREVSQSIEAAHRAAISDAVTYLEQHATYTRIGYNGAAQVDVDGLIAAVFDHRDSRAGDPDLHTHVVCANRVRAADGRWRTLDGAMFYRAVITASEIYNTRLEMHLEQQLGLVFAERADSDPNKQPVREIVGVDPLLNTYWSQRDKAVTARLSELTIEHQAIHGREPLPVEMYRLVQRAVLESRKRKREPRPLSEQRARWQHEAITVLGGAKAVADMVAAALRQPAAWRVRIDAEWISRRADQVVATLSAQRSVWHRTHVRAEVERVVRGQVAPYEWPHLAAEVEAQALDPSRSVARGDPDAQAQPELASVPQIFRRADGSSVYQSADCQLYSSPRVLSAEADLIEMARQDGGHTIAASIVDDAIDAFNNEGHQLNEGQSSAIRAFATSGLRVQFANAPAGSGKTTMMGVLAQAWVKGGGTVLGLAPTAKAAGELGASLQARAETVDKLLDVLQRHTPTAERALLASSRMPPSLPQWVLDIDARTLVIIDEHVQISNASRLRLLRFLRSRGATSRMIGDTEQLPAVGAGGIAEDMIAASGTHMMTLTHLVRFIDDSEGAASLLLREGDPAGLAYYLDHGRIHVGSPAAVADGAFAGWLFDHTNGLDSVMLAPTHAIVNDLNSLARDHRLANSNYPPGPSVELADGLNASTGDTIRTGRNNRRLVVGANDYVRNGHQWLVTEVHPDGALSAVQIKAHRQQGSAVKLPADYVAAHVRLGYAATINSAQGITADTCHTALSGRESRFQLYVAITRGRRGNQLYLTTTVDGDEESFWTEKAVHPRTGVEILVRILGRVNTAKSAHTELREALDPHSRIGRATDIYLDALGRSIEHAVGQPALAQLDREAESLRAGLTTSRGYGALRQHLSRLLLEGRDAISELSAAVAARELSSAEDIAAVVNWRLDPSGARSAPPGPLPWLPAIPDPLLNDPDTGGFLGACARLLTELATQIHTIASGHTPASAPIWARPLVGADPTLLADLAVWRAATHVDELDRRPAGPPRLIATERRHHELLTARVTEAIGDVNHAVNKWAPTVKRIATTITDDPFWPVLAERLDTADHAGIDIDALLTSAASIRPLPDEMPAAVLWSRIALGPAAMDTPPTGEANLTPEWATEVRAVLGDIAAERVLADPAWPKVVAAIDRADRSTWTPRELLEVASEMLVASRTHGDHLRPDQVATALAWRIEALSRLATPFEAPPPSEPPSVGDHLIAESDLVPLPNHIADEQHRPTEAGMTDGAHPSSDSTSAAGSPDPTPTAAPAPLPHSALPVAELLKSGDLVRAREALKKLRADYDRHVSILNRVHATRDRYPPPVAEARLEQAAQNSEVGDLIRASALWVAEAAETSGPARARDATKKLKSDYDRRISVLRRVFKTLDQYPLDVAVGRLNRAAHSSADPGLGELIGACTPELDTGPPHSDTDTQSDASASVPESVLRVAGLLKSGDLARARDAITNLGDDSTAEYISVLRRVFKTLDQYPLDV